MCDGQEADDCDVISLTQYESTLNDQLVELDGQFNEIDDELKIKKEVFVEMYRKDPRISLDREILSLKQRIRSFNPLHAQEMPALDTPETIQTRTNTATKQAIICESFADDNQNVIVSSCKRFVKSKNNSPSYCFLNDPKIEKDQLLKWSLRVPKFKCQIGIVISYFLFGITYIYGIQCYWVYNKSIFNLTVTFQSYRNICQTINEWLGKSRFEQLWSKDYCLLSEVW